jgi:hypothetical protein
MIGSKQFKEMAYVWFAEMFPDPFYLADTIIANEFFALHHRS